MHPVIRSIVISASLFVAASAGELAPLPQAHTNATEALAEQRAAELARLRSPYLDALVAADQAATEAGDATTLREIETEREAVNQGKLRAEMSKVLSRKLFPVRRALISAEPKTHAEFDEQQRSVLEGASGFLAQPQIEALKKMQEQMRTLNEAGLKMSKSMMGK
jgi:hypothetical protein